MELGKKIIEIRKCHNMTQEEFADKYYVTRQTISNWENGKSYPDLETLVSISDDFDISLDTILKGDKKMVSNISKEQKNGKKYNKVKKLFIVVLILVAFAFGFYGVCYNQTKPELENKFNNAIKENGFIAENHPAESEMYEMYKDEDGIQYRITWTAFPKFSSFHLDYEDAIKIVTAYIESEENDYSISVATLNNMTYINFNDTKEGDDAHYKWSDSLTVDGKECIATTNISAKFDMISAYKQHDEKIQRAVKRNNELYTQLFK